MRVMRRHDLTNKKTPTMTNMEDLMNYKDKYNEKDNDNCNL